MAKMGRPCIGRKPKRSLIGFRANVTELRTVKRRAHRRGLSVSDWLRSLALGPEEGIK